MKIMRAVVFLFLLWAGQSVSAVPAPEAAPVGKIIFAAGNVSLKSLSGDVIAGRSGGEVHVGETLFTGASSHMHVKMEDGALLMLRPNSSIRIAYYTIDLVNPENTRILLDMYKGVVRSVTGKGGEANHQGFRLNTPVAAIGIRGTDFTVLASNGLSSVTLSKGGVVVSPFSSACPRYSVGACDGGQSVMLTASDRQMLAEVRARASKAVRIPKARSTVVPDNVAPAHPEETKSLQGASPVSSVNQQTAMEVSATTADGKSGGVTVQQDTGESRGKTADGTKAFDAGVQVLATESSDTSGGASLFSESAESTGEIAGDGNATTVQLADGDQFTVVSSSGGSVSSGGVSDNDTGGTGATAEVASLTPVTSEVGPKDSVTSELVSRVVTEKTVSDSVQAMEEEPLTPASSGTVTPDTPDVALVEPVPSGVAKTPQPFYWGRWSAYVDSPDQAILRDPARNRQIFDANQVFLLADEEAGSPALPPAGRVSFSFDDGEAAILTGDRISPASISNARLEADFDNNRFRTGLTVSSDRLSAGSVNLASEGGIVIGDGSFRSDAGMATEVSGAFSDHADHAAYVFGNEANDIYGVTNWSR